MYEYFVDTYTMKAGILGGTNFAKENEKFKNYLEDKDYHGWEVVSISNLNSGGKQFSFEIVFRRSKQK